MVRIYDGLGPTLTFQDTLELLELVLSSFIDSERLDQWLLQITLIEIWKVTQNYFFVCLLQKGCMST